MLSCRSCESNILNFFSLGKMPLANAFLTKSQLKKEKRYDLTVAFCPKCYLVQLVKTIPPDDLFKNYIYFSSTSKTFLEHNQKTVNYLTKRLVLMPSSLVLEIASNDGAFLQFFKKLGMRILGVDPAINIAKVANERGIPTIPEFFDYKFAKTLVNKKHIKADLVYGANVLAHVPKIVDFLKGVRIILKAKGTAVFEFPYLKGLMENKFDIIYHEHVFYYGILALINLFQNAGLELYDVEQIPMQGGSLRIYASHPGIFRQTKRLLALLKKEKREELDKLETYKKLGRNITKLKKNLIQLLEKLKIKGKKIAAYSAPAKGNVLLNYFGVDKAYLDFIVDKAKEKQGLYTPGTHLLVNPLKKINEARPDYLLILCWNIAKEVIEMKELEEFKKRGGKFIIPIPRIKIV